MSDKNSEPPDNNNEFPAEKTKANIGKQSNVSKIKKEQDPDPAAQIRNDYLYLRAEFDNYKKNAIKERSDILKYSGERLASDLLAVLDVFEKALATDINENNYQSFKQGVEITAVELKKTLEKHGIFEIPSFETKFDPNLHEAISQVPTKDYSENTIIDVFKKGYKYHDKVLRHSQVVVSKELED